jgi:hypothetical protein
MSADRGRLQEVYRKFLDQVGENIQRERRLTNRKMFSVFLWCFLLPALVSVVVLFLIKARIFPVGARSYLDWLPLVFPVFYSLYVLGAEVISGIPQIFRKGGQVATLAQAALEGEWRDRVCAELQGAVSGRAEEWLWIVASLRIDLANLRYRTKYLTALAGAVFFLIMEGIDTLGGDEGKLVWIRNPLTGTLESAPSDLSQFVGLALFLVLLYLSGNQTYHSLSRYLSCAELIVLRNEGTLPEASRLRAEG